MSESTLPPYTEKNNEEVPFFRCVKAHPPPRGVKLNLLTAGHIAVTGEYRDDGGFIGWYPLLRIPPELKTQGYSVETRKTGVENANSQIV